MHSDEAIPSGSQMFPVGRGRIEARAKFRFRGEGDPFEVSKASRGANRELRFPQLTPIEFRMPP